MVEQRESIVKYRLVSIETYIVFTVFTVSIFTKHSTWHDLLRFFPVGCTRVSVIKISEKALSTMDKLALQNEPQRDYITSPCGVFFSLRSFPRFSVAFRSIYQTILHIDAFKALSSINRYWARRLNQIELHKADSTN